MNNPADTILLSALEDFWKKLNLKDPYISADGEKIASNESRDALPFSLLSGNTKFIRLAQLHAAANETRESLHTEISDAVRLKVLMEFFNGVSKSYISQRYMGMPVIWLRDGLQNQMIDIIELESFLKSKGTQLSYNEYDVIKLFSVHNHMRDFRRKIENIDIATLNEDVRQDIQDFIKEFHGSSYQVKFLLFCTLCKIQGILLAAQFALSCLFYALKVTLCAWAVIIEKYCLDMYFYNRNNPLSNIDRFVKTGFALSLSLVTLQLSNISPAAQLILASLFFTLIYPRKLDFSDPLWIFTYFCYLLILIFASLEKVLHGHMHLHMTDENTGTEQTLTVSYHFNELDIQVQENQGNAFRAQVNLHFLAGMQPDTIRTVARDAVNVVNARRARAVPTNI